MTVELQVGKRYRMRNGAITGELVSVPPYDGYGFYWGSMTWNEHGQRLQGQEFVVRVSK